MKNRDNIGDELVNECNGVIGVSVTHNNETLAKKCDADSAPFSNALASRRLHPFVENNHETLAPVTDFIFDTQSVFILLQEKDERCSFAFRIDELNKLRSGHLSIYYRKLEDLESINGLFHETKFLFIVVVSDVNHLSFAKHHHRFQKQKKMYRKASNEIKKKLF